MQGFLFVFIIDSLVGPFEEIVEKPQSLTWGDREGAAISTAAALGLRSQLRRTEISPLLTQVLFQTTADEAALAAMVFPGWSVTCGEAGTGWATGVWAADDEHRAIEAGESAAPSELCMLSSEERWREGE